MVDLAATGSYAIHVVYTLPIGDWVLGVLSCSRKAQKLVQLGALTSAHRSRVRFSCDVARPRNAIEAATSIPNLSAASFCEQVLGSLVGAVYTFGFIMMTPQLYINYKLKSVAHMPWRV